MLIDAHTHSKKSGHACFVIGIHARGIHPWDVTSPFDENSLKEYFAKIKSDVRKLYAIGECGMDRVRPGLASIDEQIKVFKWHIDLAAKEQRVLVVHCVRAYSDLLMLLKAANHCPNVVIHDYSGNAQQTQELGKFPVYFSLGRKFLRHKEIIQFIPIDRLLLETDDQNVFTIEQVYREAGSALGIEADKLEAQLLANFLAVFMDAHHVRPADFINNFN